MSNKSSGQQLNQENLKRTIGMWGAIGVSVNQIIGGGIVSLTGAAIAYTGGGVAWAYLVAAITIAFLCVPYAAVGAAKPVAGAQYTWPKLFINPTVGFFTMWCGLLAQVSLSLYGLAAGQYVHAINPWFNEAWVAFGLITFFYIANLMGASISARLGLVMLAFIIIGFGVFIILGMSEVHWQAYPEKLPNGFTKLLSAAALLTFATGGATGVAELGAEMKNPGRNIPIAMIGGTSLVGIVYVLIAIPAAGVLPIDEVANEPLSTVAKVFMPHGAWLFFIIGGAMMALVSTMNAQLLWGSKSLLAASDDGWVPKWLGAVNKRFGTPHVILTILYLVGLAPTILGIDISMIGSAAAGFTLLIFIIVLITSLRLRYVDPELHSKSPFKLGEKIHWFMVIVGIPVSLYQMFLLFSGFTFDVWIAIVTWMVIGVIIYITRHTIAIKIIRGRKIRGKN